jgi:preprotein translocase subunit SecG
MSILIPFLIVVHILICTLMIFVVLMQRPRSEGLGAAFGGSMAENLFGAQTTHVLQKFTVYLGISFFVVTLLLAILYAKAASGPTRLEEKLLQGTPAANAAATKAASDAEPNATASAPGTPTPDDTAAKEVKANSSTGAMDNATTVETSNGSAVAEQAAAPVSPAPAASPAKP